jgi:hypothetical protein
MPFMDEFYRGAELGLRVSDQRVRHTNLAERATQTNRELDIREKQTNANLSRLNLLNKQLDYDMTKQSEDDSENTLQLDALKKYKTQLTEAANNPDFGDKLPLPPAGLYGQHHTEATRAHSTYMTSRQSDKDYKRYVASIEDVNDLVDNFGLPVNWETQVNEVGQPSGQFVMQQAQQRRAGSKAAEIAEGLGVSVQDAIIRGVHPADFIGPSGKLEEALYKSAIRPFSTYITSSVTTHPSGAKSETFITEEGQARTRTYANAKSAASAFVRLKDQMRKKRADLMDMDGSALSAEAADAEVLRLYPPEVIVDVPQPDGSVRQEPVYVGSQRTVNGVVYVYIGGGHNKQENWKRLN